MHTAVTYCLLTAMLTAVRPTYCYAYCGYLLLCEILSCNYKVSSQFQLNKKTLFPWCTHTGVHEYVHASVWTCMLVCAGMDAWVRTSIYWQLHPRTYSHFVFDGQIQLGISILLFYYIYFETRHKLIFCVPYILILYSDNTFDFPVVINLSSLPLFPPSRS